MSGLSDYTLKKIMLMWYMCKFSTLAQTAKLHVVYQYIGTNSKTTCSLVYTCCCNGMMAIVNCNCRGKSISHVTGRCALFNVKLHFLIRLFILNATIKILSSQRWIIAITFVIDSLPFPLFCHDILINHYMIVLEWFFCMTEVSGIFQSRFISQRGILFLRSKFKYLPKIEYMSPFPTCQFPFTPCFVWYCIINTF